MTAPNGRTVPEELLPSYYDNFAGLPEKYQNRTPGTGHGTSHIYGCEHDGCREVGVLVSIWRAGWGYELSYLCPEHSGGDVR